MKIGIIGNGVVGSATGRSYMGFVDEVRFYDVLPERATHTIQSVLQCDVIFVCLPTPQNRDTSCAQGSPKCDTAFVDNLFYGHLGNFDRRHAVVLRSTVPIGYTRQLQDAYSVGSLVHCPEFLTARTAELDARMPARLVVGFTSPLEEVAAEDHPLVKLLHFRFPHVPIHTMSSDESEMVKLMQNGFSAVKIAFFNEMRELADRLELRWEDVLDAVLAGGWICPMHTQVPGPDGKRGFGGACLPKDLANLIQCIRDSGGKELMCYAAHVRNMRDRQAVGEQS